jgi:endogenous inhibitor of DNA gyrase (YacG/DUF329 family)
MSVSPTRACVICRREPAQAPWEPFCSERCKLQDLARWIDVRYRVPADPVQADSESEEDLDNSAGAEAKRRDRGGKRLD